MNVRIVKNRLAKLRKESKLTLQEIATLTGYDITTVSKHENHSRGLTLEAADKYSKIYKVSTVELFDILDERTNV